MERIEVKFAADEVNAKGEFAGYGAVFGNVDAYGDVIQEGAFKSTLADWHQAGKLPPMLLQHGGMGMTDSDQMPIGKWVKMSEDSRGLYAEGKLINLDTERGKTVYGALKEGVLDGLSIGYRAKEFALRSKPEDPRRTLKAVDLVELSVVTFPANGKARISQVKSAADMTTEDYRDLEANLRMKGLSRSDAVKAVSGLREWLQRDAEEPVKSLREEGFAELAALMRRNIATLT